MKIMCVFASFVKIIHNAFNLRADCQDSERRNEEQAGDVYFTLLLLLCDLATCRVYDDTSQTVQIPRN